MYVLDSCDGTIMFDTGISFFLVNRPIDGESIAGAGIKWESCPGNVSGYHRDQDKHRNHRE